VTIVDLRTFDPTTVDMSTVLIIGSSTTRLLDRPLGVRTYTPRSYPEDDAVPKP
jgi:precorrin-2 C20-methyltransferase/precorrin-3B C17-methyltransferase